MKKSILSAVAVAATFFSVSASAIPISVGFNIAAIGGFTTDTGSVFTMNTITTGAPLVVGQILANNVGLVALSPVTLSPDPLGVAVGAVFTKEFTTDLGTFLETLTVTSVSRTPNSTGVLASGTIVQIAGVGFDPTPVFWSASYTQNPGQQINGSFNNSTTPPRVPEPGSLALLGLGLVALGAARRRKV